MKLLSRLLLGGIRCHRVSRDKSHATVDFSKLTLNVNVSQSLTRLIADFLVTHTLTGNSTSSW